MQVGDLVRINESGTEGHIREIDSGFYLVQPLHGKRVWEDGSPRLIRASEINLTKIDRPTPRFS
jgi:hypothetical protein